MKNRVSNVPVALALLFILNFQLSTASAQGTAFTYQGQLTDGGGPANGLYDFRFRLASDPLADNYVGSAYLTNGVAVKNGLFTVAVDFGPGAFMGSNYWLEVDVMTNGGSGYTVLNPLQAMTPTPFALFAENAAASALAAGANNNALTFNNVSNEFTGTFNGNAAGLTNANAVTLDGLNATNFWQTSGNIGTSPTNGNFIGTADLQPVEIRVDGLRGWRVEPDGRGDGAANLIGGFVSNSVQQPGSGGDFIGAGAANQIGPNVNNDFIGAGTGNAIQSPESLIVGGDYNTISSNTFYSAIVGGGENTIYGNAQYSMIGGGLGTHIYGDIYNYGAGVVGGGFADNIYSNSWNAVIGGGAENDIADNSDHAAIVGGFGNYASGSGVFIGGGGTDGTTEYGNQAYANASVISGGLANLIEVDLPYSVIGGGVSNTIEFYSTNSTVVGGDENLIGTDSSDSFIGGGLSNTIQFVSGNSTIVGGGGNLIAEYADGSFIGGGYDNSVSNAYSTICGGYSNYATGYASTVAGGYSNTAAGDYSFAGGNGAIAYGNRSFVWNSFPSNNYVTGTNEFYVFAENGFDVDYDVETSTGNGDRWVYIGRGSAGPIYDRVSATIETWTGAYLSDSGAWVASSDRARKENFAPVDSRSVLDKVAALPVQTWKYTNEPPGFQHMGPVAQDFHAAFGLNGPDDTHIAGIDEGGVALAAIQGLNQKVEELKTELKRRDTENAELQQRLEALEQVVLKQKTK